MVEKGCENFTSKINLMVREEKQKTIYTTFDFILNFRTLMIIPESEFRKERNEPSPIFTGSHFLEFKHRFNFVEVMNDSKILCIGFGKRVDFFNIEDDPLYPKFIKSYDYSGSLIKLDEKLLLI